MLAVQLEFGFFSLILHDTISVPKPKHTSKKCTTYVKLRTVFISDVYINIYDAQEFLKIRDFVLNL